MEKDGGNTLGFLGCQARLPEGHAHRTRGQHRPPPPQGQVQEFRRDATPGPPGRHPDGREPGL